MSYSLGLAMSGLFIAVVGYLAFRFPRAFVRRPSWNRRSEPRQWQVASNRWLGGPLLFALGITMLVLAFIVR